MDYLKYVNISQGTKSSRRFSNGNTLPLVQRPFGFVSFSAQTDSSRGAWFYHPDDRSFEGIRITHQPSPWIRDHGAMVILPQSEDPYMSCERRWSGIKPDETILEPHYMKYHLIRSHSTVELTPTTYGACIRVKFDTDFNRYISVLPIGGMCGYKFDEENNRLYCYTDCNESKNFDCKMFKAYCVMQFPENSIDVKKILIEGSNGKENGFSVEGENCAIHIALKKKDVVFNIAQSYISYEQACINLMNESDFTDFDSLKERNGQEWNEYLSRIEIEESEQKMRTFYSCMYRVFLFPHKAYEIDENGEKIHFVPSEGSVKKGVRYTDNGFWDTYRTVYPLFSLIAKTEYKEMLEGFIQDYKDVGWLPRWTALDAKDCMPSTLIDAVIADAAVKGVISGEFLETAFEGMEKHANEVSPNPAYGRKGCSEYVKLGYVPCDIYKESVNMTLDAAFCDYCVAIVAQILGYDEKAKKYSERSKNYRNIFDNKTGFMRGRDQNGLYRPNFDPISWGRDYTEASAWQTTFAVQHDFDGLSELFGGRGALVSKLDEFFSQSPDYRVGGYNQEIHEMTELASGNWGQCAISNQPSFHIPFIYAYVGETEKSRYWVHRIVDEAFSANDDGFPGDEDNGTMAAWYIFAVMGIYPLCPGKAEYVNLSVKNRGLKILGNEVDFTNFNNIIRHEVVL